jgi:cation transport ATPase
MRFTWSGSARAPEVPLYVALVLGGTPLVVKLSRKLWAREFGSDFLAGVSIITAVVLQDYLVATIVVLMLSGGTALEEFATGRASRVLDALAKRMPNVAHRRSEGGVAEVALSELRVGDTLVVLPHEICPVDRVVIEGQGSMNGAYLTGEPFEVGKAPGALVLSGALNGESLLTIRTERQPTDSRYARIMRVMEETQQRRPRLRRLGDVLGAWYTPLALGIAVLAWTLSGGRAFPGGSRGCDALPAADCDTRGGDRSGFPFRPSGESSSRIRPCSKRSIPAGLLFSTKQAP